MDMANERLISFDLMADFGFFKKPDYNDGLLLSYNMLHKPALLGILGAITGFAGYKKKGELPEYYLKLQDVLVGIEPLGDEKGNFQKTSVKYTNTVGYANQDGNLLVEETMLVKPGYKCYVLLDTSNEDHENVYIHLKAGQAEYIPYLGKNEYQAWIGDNVIEYAYTPFNAEKEFTISTSFVKEGSIRRQKAKANLFFNFESMGHQKSFCYFEQLPIGFNEHLMQYESCHFAYTNWRLKPESLIGNLYEVLDENNFKKIIQLY